jgi:hypothetical protein
VAAIAVAAWVAVIMGVVSTVLQGYQPSSFGRPSPPFFLLVAALLILPGMRTLNVDRDPLSTIDPPPPPTAAASRSPRMDLLIPRLWWGVLVIFVVSMLTWIPKTWEGVFNSGMALSTVLLSVALITA